MILLCIWRRCGAQTEHWHAYEVEERPSSWARRRRKGVLAGSQYVEQQCEPLPARVGVERRRRLVERGIVLAGGGALLRNIDLLIRTETGLPVMICDKPREAVVKGSGMVLADMARHRGVTVS